MGVCMGVGCARVFVCVGGGCLHSVCVCVNRRYVWAFVREEAVQGFVCLFVWEEAVHIVCCLWKKDAVFLCVGEGCAYCLFVGVCTCLFMFFICLYVWK